MYNSIIISGLPGSGKSSLVRCLAQHYGWSVHPIREMFRERWVALPDNDKPPFPTWWSLLPREEQLRVNDELAQIVARGQIIADTRYAKYVARPDSLAIFVTAPLNVRARRVFVDGNEKYKGLSEAEIRAELFRREEDEAMIGMGLFGFDYRHKPDYRLVLDTSVMSLEEEVALVVKEMGF